MNHIDITLTLHTDNHIDHNDNRIDHIDHHIDHIYHIDFTYCDIDTRYKIHKYM